MSQAATLIGGRCNPYGAETGGPRHVLGGLHGPASAASPGQGLPASVAQGEWPCKRKAEVRCRMVCRCGHKSTNIMELCSWHDEEVWGGEVVAGVTRQVKKIVRAHGHYEEIGKRQAGLCPPCAFPGPFAALYHEQNGLSKLLGLLSQFPGGRQTAEFIRAWQRIEAIGVLFDEASAQGIIHRCPLTLVPVS